MHVVKTDSPYSIHPMFSMIESSKRTIVERTGKTYEDWLEILRAEGPQEEREQREWLKREHAFTSNYALWIVEGLAGHGPENYDPDANVEAQYSGKKAALRPMYDQLLNLGLSIAPDVKACPCGTIVPLFRKHVFAQLKATTNTRVDLGLCLRGVPASDRLIDTGGEAKGDRITHRIPITSLVEIDDFVRTWLRNAYEADL
jgi:hypothetical protein